MKKRMRIILVTAAIVLAVCAVVYYGLVLLLVQGID